MLFSPSLKKLRKKRDKLLAEKNKYQKKLASEKEKFKKASRTREWWFNYKQGIEGYTGAIEDIDKQIAKINLHIKKKLQNK